MLHEELPLLLGFDSLGKNVQVQILRHCDDRAHNHATVAA